MNVKNLILTPALVAFTTASLVGAPFNTATITTTVNDVKVSFNSAEAHTVSTGQKIGGSSTVLTGRKSRAELSFPDQTVTRIGANSVFRFSSGSRDMEIEKDSFLLQVPKNAGGATIRTATVTAAITGTTTMMEFSPGQWVKFICLEGEAQLSNKFGNKIKVTPGTMVVMRPNDRNFPRPVIVNLKKLVATSKLCNAAVFGKLNAPAMGLIKQSMNRQMMQRRAGNIGPRGMITHGPGPHGGPGSEGGEGAGTGGPSGGGGAPRAGIPPSHGGGHSPPGPIMTNS